MQKEQNVTELELIWFYLPDVGVHILPSFVP